MKCEEIVQYLSDYVDGDLPLEILEEAEKHLATCPNCTTTVKTLRETINLYKGSCKTCITPEHRATLLSAIQESAKHHCA
jgi:anti-sigma factor RsiW